MRALSMLEQYSLRMHDAEVRKTKMTVTAKAPVAKKTSSKFNKTMDDYTFTYPPFCTLHMRALRKDGRCELVSRHVYDVS